MRRRKTKFDGCASPTVDKQFAPLARHAAVEISTKRPGICHIRARRISYWRPMPVLMNMTYYSQAIRFLSVLLWLCFPAGSRPYIHQSSLDAGAKYPKYQGRSQADSTHSGARKSIAARPQAPASGVFRLKHSPLHSADLPQERVTGSAYNSSYAPLDDLVGAYSLIFLSPSQGRAPPHLA